MYFKDDQLRENPRQFGLRAFDRQQHIYDCDRPEMLSLLKELRRLLDSYPERYAVGEPLGQSFLPEKERVIKYSGADKLHAVFNFEFAWSQFNPAQYVQPILDWETAYAERGIWPNYVLGNHDAKRTATRHTKNEEDDRIKVLMAMLLTLRGTPYLYYGEEIGMRDVSLKRSEILDPPGKRYWPFYKGRDGCRAPMQWDETVNAGCSPVKTWLPAHPNYQMRNVAAQQKDPNSMLNFTRDMIKLRRANPAFVRGDFSLLTKQPKDTLAYMRNTVEQKILVALNFKNRTVHAENLPAGNWVTLFSTNRQAQSTVSLSAEALQLAPYEVLILESS
jgi:alpha-glucosidase